MKYSCTASIYLLAVNDGLPGTWIPRSFRTKNGNKHNGVAMICVMSTLGGGMLSRKLLLIAVCLISTD